MSAVVPARTFDSALSRLDPSVKLGVVLVISLVMMFVFDPVTPTVLYVLALAGVLMAGEIPPRTLALAHLPFVAFAVGMCTVNMLSRPGRVVGHIGPLQVTAEGIGVGAALSMRTLLIGVLAIGFLASTAPVALMTSLRQNLRISARATFALLAGYRMLQEMPREWETIRHAHAVRAPRSRHGGLPRRPRHLAKVAFTLLVVSLRKGERVAQSLELRGLGLNPRSTWRPMTIGRADWLFAAVSLAVVGAVLAGSAALGTLQGLGALAG